MSDFEPVVPHLADFSPVEPLDGFPPTPVTPPIIEVARLNGDDQYWVASSRMIDPDGVIDIEFNTGPNIGGGAMDFVVVSQCLTSVFGGESGKEFTLYFNSLGFLQCLIGGNFLPSSSAALIAPNTKYRYLLSNGNQYFYVDDALVRTDQVTRGAAREPVAETLIGVQQSGSGSYRGFFLGSIYDLKINSQGANEIPLTNRSQGATQLPTVGNVSATMVNYSEDVWEEI